MLFYLVVLVVLFAVELIYFRIANHFSIIDKPNQRSSHTRITLRGGGIIFYLAALIYFIISGLQYPWFFCGLSLVAFISFIDDIKPLHQYIRLLFHFTGVGLLFYQLNIFDLSIGWIILALVVCTGIINVYNFMDGINGITGGYSLVVLSALWYVNRYIEPFIDDKFLLIILSGVLVFNFFNFRKRARCFAGDVGSISMAFILIFLLGRLIIQTQNLSWIIFLVVYGCDSVLTILHRLKLKERISEPHRKHLYQIMANELKIPHYMVSIIYMLLQLFIIAGFLYFYSYGYVYLLFTCIFLVVTYIIFMKRFFFLHLNK